MTVETFNPVLLEAFGGLSLRLEGSDLPLGVSPDLLDVETTAGGVKSRGGFSSWLTVGEGGIAGLFPFTTLAGEWRVLGLSRDGTLWEKGSKGPRRIVETGLEEGLTLKGTTLFGRLYLALSDGKAGLVPPLQYDPKTGTLDRVTTAGPVEAPAVADSVAAGSILPGRRFLRVVWETRNRALVPSAQGAFWDAVGFRKADVTALQAPPEWVLRVHLYVSPVTPIGSSPVELFRAATLSNPSASSYLGLDFTESALYSGERFSDLEDAIELPPCAGICAYGERLVYWGARSSLMDEVEATDALFNLHFDSSATSLVGWEAISPGATVTSEAGSRLSLKLTASSRIRNLRDNPKVFRKGVSYSFRIRAKRTAALASGSIGLGFLSHAAVTLPVSELSTSWKTFEGEAEASGLIAPADRLEIFATSLTAGEAVYIDHVALFETSRPVNGSLVWISAAGNPERISGPLSAVVVSPEDGESVSSCFADEEALYVVKGASVHVVVDDGETEPSLWKARRLLDSVGTSSVNGVGKGPDFAVVAGRFGVFRLTKGNAESLSTEIEPLWRTIDFSRDGHQLFVAIDHERELVFVGAPLFGVSDGVGVPSPEPPPMRLLVLDYRGGRTENQGSGGRNWTLWEIPATSGVMAEDDAGTRRLLVGLSLPSTNDVPETEDFSFSPSGAWAAEDVAPSVVDGVADPLGKTDASRWSFGGVFIQELVWLPTTALVDVGGYVTASMWLRVPSGTYETELYALTLGATGESASSPITLDTEWRRFVVTLGPVSAAGNTAALGLLVAPGLVVEVFGASIQRAAFDQGYVRTAEKAAEAVSGTVAERALSATPPRTDFFKEILWRYSTAPIGGEIGRSLFDSIALKVRGEGTLSTRLIRQDGSVTEAADRSLLPAPSGDEEIRLDESATDVRVVLASGSPGAWFSLRRLALFAKPHPVTPFVEL